MKVAIFGLGYVGTVCGACFAGAGHEILGVDVNQVKVDMVNAGQSPIVEPGLADLMADGARSGQLRATTDTSQAVEWAEISLVCVGTPARDNGSLNLDYIYGVCRQIGEAMKDREGYHVVTIRSTVLPGTLDECRAVLEKASGKTAGEGFGLACNPEFLREGSAIKDFRNPPYTLVGTDDERSADALRQLYAQVDAPFYAVPVRPAETIKYVNNAYHALKVAFANEVGALCKAMDIDSHVVMELFGRDTKLNISTAYFRPGFAFGGSCLPKDLSAINYKARQMDVEMPVLGSVLASNRNHIQNGLRLIQSTGKRKIGLLGLSFKEGTDDLRESPLVTVVETLIGKGYEIRIYDRNVNLAKLMGANKAYIEQHIKHISDLFVDSVDEILETSECIVIGNADPEFTDIPGRVRPDQVVVDFVRVNRELISADNYQGICW